MTDVVVEMDNALTKLHEQEVHEFNKVIRNESFSVKDILNIESKIKKSAEVIQKLGEQIKTKVTEFNNKGWFSKNNKKVWIITILSILSYICGIIGLAYAGNEDEEKSKAGLTVGIIGGTITVLTTIYWAKVKLESDYRDKLIDVQKKADKYAKAFTRFIDIFKKIKMQEEHLSEGIEHKEPEFVYISVEDEDPETQHLLQQEDQNEQARNCIGLYQELAPELRDPEVFNRVVSIIVRSLPEHDPIRRKVEELEAHVKGKPKEVTNYLPDEIDSSAAVEWRGEAGNEKQTEDYKKKFQAYLKLTQKRFGLNQNENEMPLQFYQSKQGVKLDSGGRKV